MGDISLLEWIISMHSVAELFIYFLKADFM